MHGKSTHKKANLSGLAKSQRLANLGKNRLFELANAKPFIPEGLAGFLEKTSPLQKYLAKLAEPFKTLNHTLEPVREVLEPLAELQNIYSGFGWSGGYTYTEPSDIQTVTIEEIEATETVELPEETTDVTLENQPVIYIESQPKTKSIGKAIENLTDVQVILLWFYFMGFNTVDRLYKEYGFKPLAGLFYGFSRDLKDFSNFYPKGKKFYDIFRAVFHDFTKLRTEPLKNRRFTTNIVKPKDLETVASRFMQLGMQSIERNVREDKEKIIFNRYGKKDTFSLN